jgi:hypothetical protein
MYKRKLMKKFPMTTPLPKKTKGVEFFLIFWKKIKRNFWKKNSSYQVEIPEKNHEFGHL